ncbi:MAG TPA: dihydrofolate reductase [Rhizomicrobium sp.]|jgi:dihydrofolate reductase|nr:dihydrofolate reductase [Rhizomicrobium sp.]
MITLILAIADNGVIGRNGAIPWRISDDLKRFKQLTIGKPVVMGRKTWDSLPKKPLPERTNIVVTRQPGWKADGALAASSLDDALAQAAQAAEVMVIGGAEIYRAALAKAQRIELTEVHRPFEGDALFSFERETWREVAREEHVTPDGLSFSYVTLTRK